MQNFRILFGVRVKIEHLATLNVKKDFEKASTSTTPQFDAEDQSQIFCSFYLISVKLMFSFAKIEPN
jgi:hypothetical protein